MSYAVDNLPPQAISCSRQVLHKLCFRHSSEAYGRLGDDQGFQSWTATDGVQHTIQNPDVTPPACGHQRAPVLDGVKLPAVSRPQMQLVRGLHGPKPEFSSRRDTCNEPSRCHCDAEIWIRIGCAYQPPLKGRYGTGGDSRLERVWSDACPPQILDGGRTSFMRHIVGDHFWSLHDTEDACALHPSPLLALNCGYLHPVVSSGRRRGGSASGLCPCVPRSGRLSRPRRARTNGANAPLPLDDRRLRRLRANSR